MPLPIDDYRPALFGLVAVASVLFIQFIVADIARVVTGATPGKPVVAGPSCFVFRAERAHANSVENLGVFLVAVLLAFWVLADPTWVNLGVLSFALARGAYTVAYYANVPLLRSVFFTIGMLSSAAVLVAAVARLV